MAVVAILVAGSSRSSGSTPDPWVIHSDSMFSWSSAMSVIPQVSGQATPNPATNTWTYTYTLKNAAASTEAIMTFALAPVLALQSVGRPAHWFQTYGFADRTDALVWTVVDAGTPPVGWDSVSVFPSPFELQPGDSLTGFSIVSPNGPGMTTYYVQGFHGLALEPEEPDPPTMFNNSVTGTVVGPIGTVGVDDKPLRSGSVEFAPPAPNPTRGSVSMTYFLPAQATVHLASYDGAGRRVRVVVNGSQPAGVHSISWDGLDDDGQRIRPGVYFYKLVVGGKTAANRRVVFIR
jgi:hypothetical protein